MTISAGMQRAPTPGAERTYPRCSVHLPRVQSAPGGGCTEHHIKGTAIQYPLADPLEDPEGGTQRSALKRRPPRHTSIRFAIERNTVRTIRLEAEGARVLKAVNRRDKAVTIADLARETHLDPTVVIKHVAAGAREGLVERIDHGTYQRISHRDFVIVTRTPRRTK